MEASKIIPLLSEIRVNRFFYKSSGYIDEELKRPLIAIISSVTSTSPGHIHLDKLIDSARRGVYLAGGFTIEAHVIGPCAAYSRNYRYDLPTRDVIAQSIEIQLQQSIPDGIIFIGTCDKILPGMLMAAACLNLPTIFVTGGPSMPGEFINMKTVFPLDTVVPLVRKYISGDIDHKKLMNMIKKAEENWVYTYGACPELTTANTMQMLIETMGLMIPYSSTTPAYYSAKIRHAKESGMKIVEAVKEGIRFRDIVTVKSIENAMRILNAVGGSTNAVLHLLALANELDLINEINLDRFEEISSSTPFISPIRPNGPYTIVDFHNAGGVPVLLKVLKPLINDSRTILNRNLYEIIDEAKEADGNIIRRLDNPIQKRGAFKVLKGNLAPSGAITRYTAAKKESLQFRGKARVCNSLEEAIFRIISGDVKNGDVLIVRYEGPRGGPGMTEIVIVVFILRMLGLTDVAVITDGRYSGTTEEVLYIGYVSPEAYVGGPLSILRDDDIINIDIWAGRLDLEVTEEEIRRRMSEWVPPEPREKRGVLALWGYAAEQADKGAVLKNRL